LRKVFRHTFHAGALIEINGQCQYGSRSMWLGLVTLEPYRKAFAAKVLHSFGMEPGCKKCSGLVGIPGRRYKSPRRVRVAHVA
jgi:hypothetical protein